MKFPAEKLFKTFTQHFVLSMINEKWLITSDTVRLSDSEYQAAEIHVKLTAKLSQTFHLFRMKGVDEIDAQVRELSRGGHARGVVFANMSIQAGEHQKALEWLQSFLKQRERDSEALQLSGSWV